MPNSCLNKLLNLLADNGDKIKSIEKSSNSEELWTFYSGLSDGENGNDQGVDHSNFSDLDLKYAILKKDLSLKTLWKIYRRDKNPEIKTKSIELYLSNYPIILCPSLLLNIHKCLKEVKSLYVFTMIVVFWLLFILSITAGVILTSVLIPMVSFGLLNTVWYLTKGLTKNDKLNKIEAIALKYSVMVLTPILLPPVMAGFFMFLFVNGNFMNFNFEESDEQHLFMPLYTWSD